VGVIELEGELDMANVERLRTAVAQERSADRPDVVIDLTRCDYLDSTAIQALIGLASELRREGGELALVVPPEPAEKRRLFAITGLDRELGVYDSMGAAAVRLGGRHLNLHRATHTL
jgi:anti-sigma B factor antagonist